MPLKIFVQEVHIVRKEKDLLLNDLCPRLPYGVKFRYAYIDEFFHKKYGTSTLEGVLPPYRIIHSTLAGEEYLQIEEDEVKPYLFPLSSINEEIMDEIYDNSGVYDIGIDSPVHIEVGTTFEDLTKIINILYKHHIDYQGLIPMGLALDATGLDIY